MFLNSDFYPYFYVSIILERNLEQQAIQYVYKFRVILCYWYKCQNVYLNDSSKKAGCELLFVRSLSCETPDGWMACRLRALSVCLAA